MTPHQAVKFVALATAASLWGCGMGADTLAPEVMPDVDETEIDESLAELISGNVELTARAPLVEVISPAQSKVTATVKLTGLTPGATGTLTYSLGRQAFRHPYVVRSETRTVTLQAGVTEIADSVSVFCRSTRLPYTWFITGTLTTSGGTIAVQGNRVGARCM